MICKRQPACPARPCLPAGRRQAGLLGGGEMTQEEIRRRKLAVLEALKALGAATQEFLTAHPKNVRVIRGQEVKK